jgi:hypothetical protein
LLTAIAPSFAAPDLPADPAVWLASTKMTKTEVSLRLAQYLLTQNLVQTDVAVMAGAGIPVQRTARCSR